MRDKKEINIHIGNEIRIARKRIGLTQQQFGEMVSLGTKNVSDIERGVAGITISTLK
ncbi:helix-turn-helix domain-containing protein [[Clostridium] leptum]|nr:helix-turn-helix domain-containing protein [[Clostridium] leptum]